MAEFLLIPTQLQSSVPDKIIRIISLFILLSVIEDVQRFLFSSSAILLGLLSPNLQASKSIFLFLPSFVRVPVKAIQKTSLPGLSTLFKNLSRTPVRRKNINVLGLRMDLLNFRQYLGLWVLTCPNLFIVPGSPWNHFSGPAQFPNQHPSQKTWLWSTWLSNLCGAITTNTGSHSAPLEVTPGEGGRLLTSYSLSPGAGIATPASQCQGKHPLRTPSWSQALELEPAQVEVGVLPSFCSSGEQLTLSQFHWQMS